MADFFRYRIPIRVRLTLWYLFLMGITFAVFSLLLFTRFQRSLRDTIDQSLQLAVLQPLAVIDMEDFREVGRLTFEKAGGSRTVSLGFSMRFLSPEGTVWDSYGTEREPVWGDVKQGYSTQTGKDGNSWRSFSKPVLDSDGEIVGWIQAAQSMENMTETLDDFREQILWGIPPILILAGLGGYFLANRALNPIERITKTTHEINASDLSRRLNYQGPTDEVGQLAHTFDQMLARLENAFERERRFTSDAAHELRTPLAALKGQIEVTLNQPREVGEYENKLRELASQVDRLIRLSNALLFLSLSDQNRLSWNPVNINLGEILELIIEQIHPLVEEKKLVLNTKIQAELPVFGDTDHLTRLFLNLLDNAVKYTPPEGRVTLAAGRVPDGVRVTLHNTGAGIQAEHLPHLFDRFYRVDADRSSQTGGTGLGLAISHEIVRLHGGEISMESEYSRGVTFTVWLPASNPPNHKKTLRRLLPVS